MEPLQLGSALAVGITAGVLSARMARRRGGLQTGRAKWIMIAAIVYGAAILIAIAIAGARLS